jgi:hypothetical protein
MPFADSGQLLDWFTALALNVSAKENASAVISESSRVVG